MALALLCVLAGYEPHASLAAAAPSSRAVRAGRDGGPAIEYAWEWRGPHCARERPAREVDEGTTPDDDERATLLRAVAITTAG